MSNNSSSLGSCPIAANQTVLDDTGRHAGMDLEAAHNIVLHGDVAQVSIGPVANSHPNLCLRGFTVQERDSRWLVNHRGAIEATQAFADSDGIRLVGVDRSIPLV